MIYVVFIGFGNMGYLMVGYFVNVGYVVIVYNCSLEWVCQWFDEYFGKQVEILVLVVLEVDMVFVCVGNDDDFCQVILGDNGVVQSFKVGVVLVDYIIVSVVMVYVLDEVCWEYDVLFMDVLVFGGQ